MIYTVRTLPARWRTRRIPQPTIAAEIVVATVAVWILLGITNLVVPTTPTLAPTFAPSFIVAPLRFVSRCKKAIHALSPRILLFPSVVMTTTVVIIVHISIILSRSRFLHHHTLSAAVGIGQIILLLLRRRKIMIVLSL